MPPWPACPPASRSAPACHGRPSPAAGRRPAGRPRPGTRRRRCRPAPAPASPDRTPPRRAGRRSGAAARGHPPPARSPAPAAARRGPRSAAGRGRWTPGSRRPGWSCAAARTTRRRGPGRAGSPRASTTEPCVKAVSVLCVEVTMASAPRAMACARQRRVEAEVRAPGLVDDQRHRGRVRDGGDRLQVGQHADVAGLDQEHRPQIRVVAQRSRPPRRPAPVWQGPSPGRPAAAPRPAPDRPAPARRTSTCAAFGPRPRGRPGAPPPAPATGCRASIRPPRSGTGRRPTAVPPGAPPCPARRRPGVSRRRPRPAAGRASAAASAMPGARLCPGTVKVVPGSARNASTASASGASDGIGARRIPGRRVRPSGGSAGRRCRCEAPRRSAPRCGGDRRR